MRNSNETSANLFGNFRSENNKEDHGGFFWFIFLLWKTTVKDINQKIDILIPDFIWFYESDITEKNNEIDKVIWIQYPIELNQIIEKFFNANKHGLQINFAENKEETFIINFNEMMQFILTTSKSYANIDSNFSQNKIKASLYKRIKRLNKNEVRGY